MEDDKRTATDILLSLESKVMILEKRNQNIEYLLKLLLGKVNNSPSIIAPQSVMNFNSDVINKDNFENRPKTNVFSNMAASHGVDIENDVVIARASESDMTESPVRAASRGQRGPKSKGPKTSVSQVLNNGNSPLFLANVEVMDQNNELVSQTRTNTKGRWLMALAPGSYQVHVTKRFSPESGKTSIDSMYQIEIPPADKPLELDTFVIE